MQQTEGLSLKNCSLTQELVQAERRLQDLYEEYIYIFFQNWECTRSDEKMHCTGSACCQPKTIRIVGPWRSVHTPRAISPLVMLHRNTCVYFFAILCEGATHKQYYTCLTMHVCLIFFILLHKGKLKCNQIPLEVIWLVKGSHLLRHTFLLFFSLYVIPQAQ